MTVYSLHAAWLLALANSVSPPARPSARMSSQLYSTQIFHSSYVFTRSENSLTLHVVYI